MPIGFIAVHVKLCLTYKIIGTMIYNYVSKNASISVEMWDEVVCP